VLLTRHASRHRRLLVLPTVRLVEVEVLDEHFLRQQFVGRDTVINLVGILNEAGHSGQGFARMHADLPENVVRACQASGVSRLLHMSALRASRSAPSYYLRSKALGEACVQRAESPSLHVTSFRPSVIFGPGDSFLNRFAGLIRWVPGVFPLACADARFQPVYVDDVARVFVEALDDHTSYGKGYDLCGPTIYRLRDIVQYVATLLGKKISVIGLPNALSYAQAALLEYVPGKPFSLDNYHSLQLDSVCTESQSNWPTALSTRLEQIAPGYLHC